MEDREGSESSIDPADVGEVFTGLGDEAAADLRRNRHPIGFSGSGMHVVEGSNPDRVANDLEHTRFRRLLKSLSPKQRDGVNGQTLLVALQRAERIKELPQEPQEPGESSRRNYFNEQFLVMSPDGSCVCYDPDLDPDLGDRSDLLVTAVLSESLASAPEASDGDATVAESDIGPTVFDLEDPYGMADGYELDEYLDHEDDVEGEPDERVPVLDFE